MNFRSKATPESMSEQAVGQAPEELLRRMMQEMVQSAIQQEFEHFMGAGPWLRNEQRRGWRNGSKRRRLHTRVGTIELRIPKDRDGRFQPTLFCTRPDHHASGRETTENSALDRGVVLGGQVTLARR
jgi:transposase-like protein